MEFHQHSLREQSNACNLREAIRITMVGKYTDIRKKYQAAASTSDSQLDVKQNEECAKKATALISKLSNYSYKNTIVKSAQPFFEIRNFSSIRDSNPCKTGWKNCVVTCYKEHAYISNGKLEDFITKTTHKKYNKDLSWGHPIVVELKNWFSQMFPDQELMKYMFRDMSSYLYGRNSEKILRAWCGDGNNSKTMLAKCIQEAFGSYSIDFPPSFLTAKALGSSGPNPELAQAQGAHIGFVPETEDDEKVREGAVKRATGGDRQFARNLNENGGSMEMGCKIVLMCNKIPEFTSISKALVARFVNIPFLGNWSDEAPTLLADQIEQNHYKMDPLFEERIPELSVALAWAAVQYYPVYKKEGLTSPSIIKRYTRQHWEDNDPVLCFVQERVENVYKIGENGEKIPDSNASLSCSQIYTVYKSWFGQRYPGTTPSAMNAFKVNLELQMGKAGPSKKWGGVAIVQMIANVSEGRSGNGNDMDNMNS
jgi:phage/plasmid-associated DNA primase